MTAPVQGATPLPPGTVRRPLLPVDLRLPLATVALLALGLVMVASASVTIAERQAADPLYYFWRQGLYVLLGLALAFSVLRVPLRSWAAASPWLVVAAFGLLVVVLIPGVGHEVNGSVRWLRLGVFNVQVSEPVKLFAVIYLAGYLVRHGEAARTTWGGVLKPLALLGVLSLLLLMQPDFGAAAVMLVTALGVLFLAGARLLHFGALLLALGAALAALAITSPYRLGRLTSFMDPWADPFNSGFQLTQALIAFGRGEWFGVGLGSGIQKLFYLPEAHTDFLFAVLAEELGLIGGLVVVTLFALLIWRALVIARLAERAQMAFGAYLAYGLALWIGLQAFINLGVSMGVLPTKGLTLPLMSYGGSSMVVTLVALALLLRVEYEARHGEETRA
ncbi:putative lipid II flippase FtsW [Ectothiorhodospiraceae bacterium 2226]|nr:putative lipid II flippase FtsW [Ectothiorhodospiraceae bacterium 2226]